LKSQSMVTGKLKVQLIYHKDSPAVLKGEGHPLPEIPTIPGSLDSLAKRIGKLPLDEIVLDLRESTKAFAEIAKSGKLQETINELQKTMHALSEMANSEELKDSLASLNKTLAQGQKIMAEMSEGAEPIRKEVIIVLEELSDAARSLQYLTDYLERHPESLIRGKGKE
jgi:paraquat-inducible protein B